MEPNDPFCKFLPSINVYLETLNIIVGAFYLTAVLAIRIGQFNYEFKENSNDIM